jgi:hypothetical protein
MEQAGSDNTLIEALYQLCSTKPKVTCQEIDDACLDLGALVTYAHNNTGAFVSHPGLVNFYNFCYYGLGGLSVVMSLLYLWLRVWPLKNK